MRGVRHEQRAEETSRCRRSRQTPYAATHGRGKGGSWAEGWPEGRQGPRQSAERCQAERDRPKGRSEAVGEERSEMTPNGNSRLDRIEANLERLTDVVGQLANVTRDAILKLAEAQNHTEERLNALIKVVDSIVRDRGPQA